MKKILLSLFSIAAVGVVAFGATTAFFSDTETSTGNTFTAGAIDLKIDNESYAIDFTIPNYPNPTGKLVRSDGTTWTLNDLTDQVFFNFIDLKPGDIGEDTISIHVDNNDAWACVAIEITEDSDVDYTEPEIVDDSTVELGDPLNTDGELPDELQFAVWADDGDNVFEDGEQLLQLGGPGVPIVTLQELAGLSEVEGSIGVLTLADSLYSVFADDNAGEPLEGEKEYYLAKAWCFGTLTSTPVGAPEDDSDPVTRGTGFTCSGAGVDNKAQTDRVVGSLEFYAEQARNNPDFLCGVSWPTP